EGYATFVEGRVTGSGRPHAAWRAALLREWALEGQLPRYQELDASGAYEGGSYAYLVGSAFLEWLAASHGDSSLVDVWRRLSAKQNRTFAEAFTGVYGDAPATLYGRFSAELSGKAVAVARAMADAGADTGEIVQRLTRSTGDPAISADGQRAALVLRSATMPSRVVVWRTAPEPDTLKRRRDSLLVAADPEDVPSRPIFPPAKRQLASLRSKGGAPYESPRFLRDGRLLLSRPTPRGDGSLVSDLYVWNWREGGVRRVTHDESLHDADPLPDGRRAVATQCRGGWCGLVLVALDDGAVTPILPGTREHSFYRPRASASGASALVSVHSSGRWRLATVSLQSHAMSPIDARDSVVRYDAAWLGPDEIVTTAELGGIANLERLNLRTLEGRQLSAVTGAAVASEPNPVDGSVWFLSLSAHGYDVRRLTRAQVAAGVAASRAIAGVQSAPAVSPAPTETRSFGQNAVSQERRYALAPRSFRWIPRPSLDADAISGGLSLVSRDVVGLSELTANLAYGDHASWRGVTVTG
ncbi:MAG: TolB family protein, partial [bacterium]